MLAALHELRVAPGDAIYVPAGTAHAIGAGILMVELQEPTDFSVLLEWEGFELSEDDGHLGLGWDRALEALDLGAAPPPATTLPPEAGRFFRAEWLDGDTELEPGYSIVVGLAGSGTLAGMPFGRGTVALVPYGAGAVELRGDVRALRARPADPDAGASC
jgi:mannose-6-phosphate isomerase